jgi:Tol biopolymer transport system component
MSKQLLFFLILSLLFGCKTQYVKFDPELPGLTPKIFAKDVIAKNGEHVGYCAFSSDGSDFYYAVTTDDWFPSKLMKVSAHKLQQKDTLYLKDSLYEGEPFITRDGRTLYFMVVVPPKEGGLWQSDIYRAQKTTSGWSTPEKLDTTINSKASEWHVSLTNNNSIYFTSEREKGTSALHGDIYKAEWADGKFVNRVKLPYPINTDFNDSDPLIAPDESFLIFHSDRPGGFGQHDLYITFHNKGRWTQPVNMGKEINSEEWEMAPSLTPDGKFLLFTRRKEMKTTEPAKIYWVSTKILDKYKNGVQDEKL